MCPGHSWRGSDLRLRGGIRWYKQHIEKYGGKAQVVDLWMGVIDFDIILFPYESYE